MFWKFLFAYGLALGGSPWAQHPDIPSRSDAPAAGSDSLTLAEAIDLARERHPGLAAHRSEVSAREAGLSQASRGLNPELSVEIEDVAGSGAYRGAEAAQTTVQLSQTLEWGGKRGRREKIAAAEKRLAETELDRKLLEVRALASGHFMEALNAQRRLSLAAESKDLSQRLLEAVARRVKEGAASTADEIRAHLAVTQTEMEVRQSALRLDASKRKLALLWGDEKKLPPLRDEPDSLRNPPPLEDLFRKIESGPIAAAQAVNVKLAEARRDQQQGLSGPDITVNAGLRHIAEPGDLALVGGISMPLPLRNRNQGGREEARHGVERAKAEQRSTVLELKSIVGETHKDLLLARDEIETLRTSIIPDAVKAAGVLEEGYRRGRFGVLEVLDAESELFRHRSRLLESLLQYQLGYATLGRLMGTGD